MNNVPKPKYIKTVDKISALYEGALKDLYNILIKELALKGINDPRVINQTKIIVQIEQRLLQLQNDVTPLTLQALREAYTQGELDYVLGLYESDSLDDAMKKVGHTIVDTKRVEALYSDTLREVLKATKNTAVNIKTLVRKTAQKVIQHRLAVSQNKREAMKQLYDELCKKGLSPKITDEGFVGIVDKSGRRWNLKTYSDMLINTKVQQAHVQATQEKSEEYGIDLAIISKHGAKDACRKFEGMVISLRGETKGFPTYEELRRTKQIFHPNCRHNVTPIRDYDKLSDKFKESHKKAMKEYQKYKK
ncbi:MAG: minor capsid protein 2 [Bacteriophage sp.]|nr:MAG: minor capsid protein 2 [Bacteriophage sp.]